MAEYIKQKIQGGKKSICDSCTHRNVCKAIDNQPCTECNYYQCTADVEPVHEWISAKDRLPDLIPCNAGTAYSEAVIAWTSGRKVMIAVWDGIDWIAPFDYWEAWGEEITHWMPLPEPPKGE